MKQFKLLLLWIVAMTPLMADAQIVYSNRKLNINTSQTNNFGLIINEWHKLKWTCKNEKNYLWIDLAPANPRFYGTGNKIVFYNTETSTFNSIEVASVLNHSDARSKKDIETLTSGLHTLLQLKPVSYHWKTQNDESYAMTNGVLNNTLSENDSTTVSYGPAEESSLQYGFLAQDVEKVLPDIVENSSGGAKLINYIALIPILVQSIQELQGIIEAQTTTIEELSSGQQTLQKPLPQDNTILSCVPNLTTGIVSISTQLKDDVSSAKLVISSIKGEYKTESAISYINPNTSIDISSWQNGLCMVSLYVNNELTDFCRLSKE
ncbi:MAG: tail fiber domain-containing protein [Muribaculaceae bacterium]|nr:tail fiber domain-containing protein [Muribaculaceae bacterium]